jgi:pimeloyl-ACP methyl ester carboxylesterase
MSKQRPEGLPQLRGGVSLLRQSFGFVTQQVHQFHRAISDIPFKAVNHTPAAVGGKPVSVLHNQITDGVYAAVKISGEAGLQLLESAIKAAEKEGVTLPRVQHPLLDDVGSAVSGLIGDSMAVERNPLTPKMAFYQDGAPVTDLSAYTGKVVVFVHGLCYNEHSWRLFQSPLQPKNYGDQLEALGYQVLYLRYNTGLHIDKNGERLARLLDKVPAHSLTLIGHSMGGLVIRSSMRAAAPWLEKVQQVVCLGSPHLGAPLERLAHGGAALLQAFSLSKPWGAILQLRSVGIRDLHDGVSFAEAPLLAGVRYRFIGSELSEYFPTLGDGLVPLDSSLKRHQAVENVQMAGLNHFELLNHPRVWAALGF